MAVVLHDDVGKTSYRRAASAGLIHGNATLLKWQVFAASVRDRLVGCGHLHPPEGRRRCSSRCGCPTENMEIGDIAEHGHEVYPSDIPSLGYPDGVPGVATGEAAPSTV